jgi:hypothetical protein
VSRRLHGSLTVIGWYDQVLMIVVGCGAPLTSSVE